MLTNVKKILASAAALLASLTGWSQTPAPTAVTHSDWSHNAVIYEVNLRQFTPEGTLQAFSRQLPRLKDLGADILWFMPVHPISQDGRKGNLGSYYAVKDYKAINPEFGTLDDFRKVVDAAHKLGMKVIIDWVPNHSGRDNAWVTAHPDWYARNDRGEMYGPFDWTDVYKFDYSNPDMRAAMTDAMKFWLEKADIDGFRCDVAGQVPVTFWNECRPELEKVKKDIFMLAEATEPELMEQAFDMAYNWPMKDLFSAIAATQGQYTFRGADGKVRTFPAAKATDIYTLLDKQAAEYPAGAFMMNMITNHALNSWEGTEFERLGNLQQAFAVLTYTLPGMPLIYTGQEVGLDRALQFFEKDTAPDWQSNRDITLFYQKLNALKHDYPELAAGLENMQRLPTASDNVLAFRRGRVLTLVNLSNETAKIFAEGQAPAPGKNVHNYFTGATTLPDTLAPGEALIFVND